MSETRQQQRTGQPPRDDQGLADLLCRLLRPAHPALADTLTAQPGEATDIMIDDLCRRRVLVVQRLGSADDLVPGSRVICLPPRGVPVLLEALEDHGFVVEVGATGISRRASRAGIASVFPCDALYVPRRSDAAASTVGAGAGTAVYLKLVAQVLGLAMPICMMLIIDKVVTQGAENTLKALLAGVALLTVFQYLFLWLHAVHGARRAELHAHAERVQTFAELLACRSGRRWGSLGWEVVSSCLDRARFQVETRPQFFADCCYVVLLAALMAAFNPWLALLSAAFLPLYLGVDVWGGREARRYLTRCAEQRNALSAHYFESVADGEAIHALDLAGHTTARWRDADAALAANRYQAGLYARLSALGVEFLQKLSLILLALVGVGAVMDGTMTLGQYIAFNLLCMQLGQPVLRMAAFRRARDDHGVTARASRQLGGHCSADPWVSGGALKLPAQRHSTLHVDRVVMAQDGEQPGKAISFALAPGSWLGMTGPSGCGKSSLLRVMAGLDRPASGQVRVDGLAVAQIDRAQLARQIRLVGQRTAVFSASIAENLRLGDPAAAPQQIIAAARVCGLLELAEKLPGHLDTLVGPEGQPLSGGEQQRIALARALLSRPRVLLLDEATAALDPAAEAALLRNLRAFLPNAAVVLVAHRASSLAHCGRILRLGAPAAGGTQPPVLAAAAG